MDVDNEDIESVTDLGLSIGYANHCIQRRLSVDSSAGANAGSRIYMTFVAAEPLSELVWSRDKGPSNVTLSPPQSNTGGRSSTDRLIDAEAFITPQTLLQLNSGVSGKDMTASPTSDVGMKTHEHQIGTGGNVEEVKTAVEVSVPCSQEGICSPINLQIDEIPETKGEKFTTLSGNVEREGVDILLNESDQIIPFEEQKEPLLGDPVDRGGHADVGNQKMEIDFALTSEVHPLNENEASGAPLASQTPQAGRLLDKLEATAENDLQNLKGEHPYDAPSHILGPECAPLVKERCEQGDAILPGNKSVWDKHSPSNSRINIHQSKGKEKALSDSLNGDTSKDEDDSHESVESCNSARLFSSSNKRWRFEEEFIVESKRFRKKIQKTPACTSYVRHDSSFMNWISSMVNGFSKSMQDEAPSLALTLAHPPDHGHDNPDKKLIACSQDAGGKNIGFQSIFESLYCSKAEHQETRMLNGNRQLVEISTQLEPATTTKACRGENINVDRRFLPSVETFNKSTSGNNVCSGTQPNCLSAQAAGSHQTGNTNPSKRHSAGNLPFPIKKYKVSSNSSAGKRKKKSANNVESSPQSEEKTTDRFGRRNDLLGSFWITRFTPKTPSLMSDQNNKNADRVLECSNEHKNVGAKEQSAEDLVIVIGNDLQSYAADNEGSVAVNRNEGQNDQNSMSKFNDVLSSPKFRSSDAMASVFARRLDALKHITPSGETGNAAHETVTCFFCGIKGHHLRECSEIRDMELQELLSKLKSYNGAEYLPCFCIKCSECSHWAVACPNTPSRGQPQLESNVLCSDYDCSPSEVKLKSRNYGNMKLQTGKENQFQASVAHASGDRVDSRMETNLNLSWKANEMIASKKMRYRSNLVNKCSASGSWESRLKDNQIMPLSQLVNTEISDVPKEIFDSINRLRLSRTDVLKWMKSHTSLSQLEGFFLRLRLGKWEEGLGGTGYYVSCITGFPMEGCPHNEKNSIAVVVGGTRCFVESRYVSNHDFREDELRTWLAATSKGRGQLPLEEELKEKVKRKKMLGF